MSRINGDKARAAIQRKNAVKMRMKTRPLRAEAGQPGVKPAEKTAQKTEKKA